MKQNTQNYLNSDIPEAERELRRSIIGNVDITAKGVQANASSIADSREFVPNDLMEGPGTRHRQTKQVGF